MGAASQRKGRTAELELSRLLQSKGYHVEPGEPLNYGTQPDVRGLDGIHIEVKRAEQLRLSEWLSQAERDAERFGDGLPAVFHRRSRSPWLVTMTLEGWVKLYERQPAPPPEVTTLPGVSSQNQPGPSEDKTFPK